MAYDIKQSFLNLARYNERVNQEMVAVLAVLTGRAPRFWIVWGWPIASRTTSPTLRVNDKMPQM